ncbi:MAG: diguanylate cyclase domain-containing protein, partial [Clostridium sp.]
MNEISRAHSRFDLINELQDKEKEYFIICLDIISFRAINEMYGFKEGDLILKELINYIDSLNKIVGIKSFIYEKDTVNLIVDSTDENEIKIIIKEIVLSIFSYDIKFRCAYRKISYLSQSIEFIENINKVIRKNKYVVTPNKAFDFDSSYDLDEYTAIKQ